MFKFNKRGQGLPIETVIILVIGIVAAVIIVSALLSSSNDGNAQTSELVDSVCSNNGGECISSNNLVGEDKDCPNNRKELFSCSKGGKCCEK